MFTRRTGKYSRLRKATARFLANEDGAYAIEFVIVFPIFFMLIIATIELFMIMFTEVAAESGLYASARAGAVVSGTPASRGAAIKGALERYSFGYVDTVDVTARAYDDYISLAGDIASGSFTGGQVVPANSAESRIMLYEVETSVDLYLLGTILGRKSIDRTYQLVIQNERYQG